MTKEYVDTVLVVDDGSIDRTSEVAELAGANVLRLDENQGKAGALMAGFSFVKENDYDIVVMLDADGQNNPSEIPVVLGPILSGEFDMVIGSRFMKDDYKIPRYRQFGQKVLNSVSHASSGAKIGDSQSGFRALNKQCLLEMDLQSKGFSVESDMINRAVDSNLRIIEVPITVRYDVPNPHKKNPLTHGMGVLGNIINTLGYRRPLMMFGFIGAILILVGVIVTALNFMESNSIFMNILGLRWSFWSMMFIFSGFITFVFGLMLNSQVMIKHELMKLEDKINNKK
jgi:glycosyltransferase involved in cell wall biosynthesis